MILFLACLAYLGPWAALAAYLLTLEAPATYAAAVTPQHL